MGKSKIKSITRKLHVSPVPEALKKACLSPKDLMELQLRAQALTAITHQRMLVEEAYQAWVAKTLLAYGCAGQFDIDMRSGELTPKKVANG